MRLTTIILVLALSTGVLTGCGDDEEKGKAGQQGYFGWVLGASEPTAVALEVEKPNEQGKVKVRAYVCDGLGPPRGKAIWFLGTVDGEAVKRRGASATLTAAGGKQKLEIDNITKPSVSGSFRDAKGNKSQFVANPVQDGAGIYEVTLDEKLRYSGTSTDGSKLKAKADRNGGTKGTITTADGEDLAFSVQSLALATPAQLSGRGLSRSYKQYVRNNQVPGQYVAVIAPGGSFWLGRSGDVRGGRPGRNIIGLDKKC
ncbi:MAG: hypothetical protein LC808_08525 [Actinobacteria bacterium]|nr:hypothetical protein [Actinomycetota bacterium]